jgi:hypothetical protein
MAPSGGEGGSGGANRRFATELRIPPAPLFKKFGSFVKQNSHESLGGFEGFPRPEEAKQRRRLRGQSRRKRV